MDKMFKGLIVLCIIGTSTFATEPGSWDTQYYYPQFCLNDSFVVYGTKLYYDYEENGDEETERKVDTLPLRQLMIGQIYYSTIHHSSLFTDSIIAPIWMEKGRFRDYISKSIWFGNGGVFVCENDLWWKSALCVDNIGPNSSAGITWVNINSDGKGFVYQNDGGHYGLYNGSINYVNGEVGDFQKRPLYFNAWDIYNKMPSFIGCLVKDTICLAFGKTPFPHIYEVGGFSNNKEANENFIFIRNYDFKNKKWVTVDSSYIPQAMQDTTEKVLYTLDYKMIFSDERKDTREHCSWPLVSPDGEKLLAVFNNNLANLVNLKDRTPKKEYVYKQPILAASWLSPNVFSLSTTDSLYINSLTNQKLNRKYAVKTKLFTQLPNTSSILFVNENDGTLSLINRVTNAITKGPTIEKVKWLEASPDGSNVLFLTSGRGGSHNTCIVYNVKENTLRQLKIDSAAKIDKYYCARWLNNRQIVADVRIEGSGVNIVTYDAFTGKCVNVIENIPCEQMNEDYLEYFDIMKSKDYIAIGPRLFRLNDNKIK